MSQIYQLRTELPPEHKNFSFFIPSDQVMHQQIQQPSLIPSISNQYRFHQLNEKRVENKTFCPRRSTNHSDGNTFPYAGTLSFNQDTCLNIETYDLLPQNALHSADV